jgi:putative nucleotidyltransferase with HDIG domain
MQLLQELQSESSSIETITRLITQDMALSVKILQLVNSAYFGIGKTVSSISQAVVLLGTDTLKSLVLTSQLFSHFDTTSRKSISLEELWDHSWIVGKWAQAIAQKETADPETMNLALLTGLVHDIGKLVLAAYMLEKYQEVLHREVEDPSLIYNIERQVLGITHTEVGAYLLGLWGFSPNIVEAVAWHHSPACSSATGGDVLAFVYAANQLTHEFDANPGEDSDSPLSHDSYLESTGFIQHLPDWRLLNPGVKVANTTF